MIAILLIMPLVLIAISNINFNEAELDMAATRVSGEKLAAFTKSINDDMPRALEIMSKRALTEAVIRIENSGTPLADSSATLSELITNGTIEGQPTGTNFTVTIWTTLLAQKGQQYGFDTKVNVIGTRFYSMDSEHIAAEVSISVNTSNSNAKMGLYRIYNTTVAVPIEGLDDPLYTLKTNGILKRTVSFPNLTVSGYAPFDSAVTNEFYMPSSGPNFLDRMEGRLISSGKYGAGGLETVVFLPDLQSNGLTVKNSQSVIDYLYFDSAVYSGQTVVNSTYTWLKIDPVHAAIYNLTLG